MSTEKTNERKPLTTAEGQKIFGKFDYKVLSGGAIKITDDWVTNNIERVYVPQLAGVPVEGGTFKGYVNFHKLAKEQLLRAWADVEAQGLMKLVLSWDGSYNPRMVRGSTTTLSKHADGTAFDINAQWNWLNSEPAKKGQKGCLLPLVPIFETHGFYWGGNFKRKDGMHFEVCERIDYAPAKTPAKLVIDNDWKNAIDIELDGGVAYASAKAMSLAIDEKWEGDDAEVPVASFMVGHGRKVYWNAEQKKVYAVSV